MSIAWKNSATVAAERRAARVRDAQPAAEARLHLRVDEAVGEPVLRGQGCGHGPAGLAEARHPVADP